MDDLIKVLNNTIEGLQQIHQLTEDHIQVEVYSIVTSTLEVIRDGLQEIVIDNEEKPCELGSHRA